MSGTSDVWEQAKKVLRTRVGEFPFRMRYRATFLAEDQEQLIVVDVDSAFTVSDLARRHAAEIFSALDEVGRHNTKVRLRVDLSHGNDTPDWYVRDLAPPSADVRQDPGAPRGG